MNNQRFKMFFLFFIVMCCLTACSHVKDSTENEDSYLTILEQMADGNEYFMNALKYQIMQPCHFVMYVDIGPSSDVYEYRNIKTDNLLNEWGDVALEHMQDAYLADVVLDKYIREYGGEDVKYNIKNVTAEKRKDIPQLGFSTVDFIEVDGADVKLSIIWNYYYDGIVSVLIENKEDPEIKINDFSMLAQYALDYKDYIYSAKKTEYYMFINPEVDPERYFYRNVNPDETMGSNVDEDCNMLGYYIADQVIDRYIRDYQGSDRMYKVILLSKEKNEDVYHYALLIDADTKMLQVEYADASWFVRVKINEK